MTDKIQMSEPPAAERESHDTLEINNFIAKHSLSVFRLSVTFPDKSTQTPK